MKGRITKLGAVALATAIGFATVATMVQAADPITERRAAMKGNGAAMKAINEVLKNGGAAADLEKHANQLNDTAMKIGTLFPAGTDQPHGKDPGQTMAKPEIWRNPDDFAMRVHWRGSRADGLKSWGDSVPSPHSRPVKVLTVKWTNSARSSRCQRSCAGDGRGRGSAARTCLDAHTAPAHASKVLRCIIPRFPLPTSHFPLPTSH